jgi:hypothetical protein
MAVIKIVPMPGAEGQQGETGAVGPQGPQGDTGATGPAGADAVWYYNGEYNPGASYVVGDVVTYDGQLWYRKHANGGNVGDTPSEGFIWDLLAAKGESGTPLNFWNYVGERGLPTEDGLLVVDGISGREAPGEGNVAIFAGPSASVILAGNNGEFLKDSNVPENQIATVGDIESIDTLSNGLVVTGLIDDPVINPAGTMSLSVQDGYTALQDLVAANATFNANVTLTNFFEGQEILQIRTSNYQEELDGEDSEAWTFTDDGYLLGPWKPGENSSFLRVRGINRGDGDPLLISSSGPVLINGTGGEFLNFHGDPNNQIATIGDIKETALNYSNSTVPPTHHGSVGDLKNDIRYDATHLYICIEDYTDGTAIIWKRINWASGNW